MPYLLPLSTLVPSWRTSFGWTTRAAARVIMSENLHARPCGKGNAAKRRELAILDDIAYARKFSTYHERLVSYGDKGD